MKFARIAAAATLALLAAQAPGDQPVHLHATMKNIVAPQAQALWDVGNRTMNDNGDADPSRIKPADWVALSKSAQTMKAAALSLAGASRVIVAAPGEKLQDEGAPGGITAAQMQALIDADRPGFAKHASELASVADDFLQAATARDAVRLTAASGRLDEVCESCHTRFWYPNQGGAK